MKCTALIVVLSLFLATGAYALTLTGVPAYDRTIGCSPTAAGMIMGYYDLLGYDNLMAASGWASVSLTSNVGAEIGMLATAMHTIIGSGSTYVSDFASGVVNFASNQGYGFTATTTDFRDFTWLDFKAEIDAGRPMLLAVDSNGDWDVDHTTVAMGYEERLDGMYYSFYSGWSEAEAPQWQPFSWSVYNNNPWGIGFATFISPVNEGGGSGGTGRNTTSVPVPEPEPGVLMMLGFGFILLASAAKKRFTC